MLAATFLRGMSRSVARVASQRTKAISQQMMSTSTTHPEEPTVLFESNGALRRYILNRPSKLNALDEPMLSLLRPKIEEWSASELCGTIVGSSVGRAFCVGGDVASVVLNAIDPKTRAQAIDYFKREFEMDYILASLQKPYVAIMDGPTLGGGAGLAALATFRVATEKTVFAMPETKIGYCPDVGGSFFLSRLDGQLGTYLALTSDTLSGRAVFNHGFATHFIPSRRIPILLERLAALEHPHASQIDSAIEELSSEREPHETPSPLIGAKRAALDFAFRHDTVESIIGDLQALTNHKDQPVSLWAKDTITMLELRSPTSLKVALKAIRSGKNMTLLEALQMELKIATAFCSGASPDFFTGVRSVLVEKTKNRPNWSPSALAEVDDSIVSRFFDPKSPFLSDVPQLEIPPNCESVKIPDPMKYSLPTEEEIGLVVRGSHSSGGATGIRLDELQSRFVTLRPGKHGVREKVAEVAERRCILQDNADDNKVWLKWVHESS